MGLLDGLGSLLYGAAQNTNSFLDDPAGSVKGLLSDRLQQWADSAAANTQAAQMAMSKGPAMQDVGFQRMLDATVNHGGILGMFGGAGSKMADQGALTIAQKLAADGATPQKIWDKTGWFQGPDSKWRYEINDSTSSLGVGDTAGDVLNNHIQKYNTMPTVGDALYHGPLRSAYPDVMDIYASAMPQNVMGNARGSLTHINGDPTNMYLLDTLPNAQAHSTTLHEMQHAIQAKEGFASGGSPADFSPNDPAIQGMAMILDAKMKNAQKIGDKAAFQSYYNQLYRLVGSDTGPREAYRRLAGEAEARAVQARMHMTPDERAATPPWRSYDVPWDQLIVK